MGGQQSWRRLRGALVLCVAGVLLATGTAAAETCQRSDFEAVVDEASNTLLVLTQKNMPAFQSKLRELKAKRNWSNEQLIKEGAAYVRDERIAAFDEQSEQLLVKINTQSGDSSDCKVLAGLKEAMRALVDTQQAKWKYMFDKIEAALGQ